VNRDERIESYYNWPAWDLAEKIVDLEDQNDKLLSELMSAENKLTQYEDDINWLRALEAAGVDNWEGYEIAYQLYKGEITEDEL